MAATSAPDGHIQQYNYRKARWEWKTYLGNYLKVKKKLGNGYDGF